MLQCDVIVLFLFILLSYMTDRCLPILYGIILVILFPYDMLTRGCFPGDMGLIPWFDRIYTVSFPAIKRAFFSSHFSSCLLFFEQNIPVTLVHWPDFIRELVYYTRHLFIPSCRQRESCPNINTALGARLSHKPHRY